MSAPALERPWMKAYALGATDGWSIEPAAAKRVWMDETYKRLAYPFDAAPPEVQHGFHDFVQGRSANIAVAEQGGYETQRDYHAGRYPDGSAARYPSDDASAGAPTHRTASRSSPSGAKPFAPLFWMHDTFRRATRRFLISKFSAKKNSASC